MSTMLLYLDMYYAALLRYVLTLLFKFMTTFKNGNCYEEFMLASYTTLNSKRAKRSRTKKEDISAVRNLEDMQPSIESGLSRKSQLSLHLLT